MQGNGRERNRKGPPITFPPIHPQAIHPGWPGKSCARCKEQDRGWLCCQKNLARLSCASRLPPAVLSRPHTPSSCLLMSGWHGRRGPPLCSGTANLAANLADGAGRCGSVHPGLRPKSAPNWVAMMQAQRCIPNPHPHPNVCTHPPSVPTAEMARDHERQIGKRPSHTMACHD